MSEFYKQVFVKVTTDTQYDSIKPVLKRFVENEISFDIFIPKRKENIRNVNKMFEKTFNLVKKDGFDNIIREVLPKNRYHLALIAPHYEEAISAKYYIKYSYGSVHSVKPSLTHQAHRLNRYHAYFVYNSRDTEIFSAFSKTYLLPDLKHVNYKRATRETKLKKQTILFLPSWEDQNNLNWIMVAARELKRNYNIVVKLHPYGDFGAEINESSESAKAKIKEIADEYYEGEGPLSKLLGSSDLVVSGISGAVFDALYVGVPVTMYSKNIHQFDAEGIMSANAKYAEEGYISLSSTPKELIKKIPIALSSKYFQRQQELSSRIFCQVSTSKSVDSWMKVINKYLNDEVNQEYIAMHDILTGEFWQYKSKADRLEREVDRLEREVREKDNELSSLSSELKSFLVVGRSARLLAGNVKRKTKKIMKDN